MEDGFFSSNKSRLVVLFLLVMVQASSSYESVENQCSVGFYSQSCPQAESIIRSTLISIVRSNPIIPGRLLRMFFHDCFVRGCDASVLIDGAGTERQAGPNLNLVGGYEAVDQIKAKLEAACPGVVSCADIIAIAARDSVVLSGGQSWQVPTGRRDGRVSIGSETSALVGPNESIESQKQKFANQGLNSEELVILVGGHTIGQTACQFFSDRIYGNNTDPSIDPSFVPFLKQICPQNQGTKRVALDTGSQFRFDTSYFANLQRGHGILRSDQLLWTDSSTKGFVQKYSAPGAFNVAFARAMVKMGNIGIKTGSNGEIRKICSAIN